MNQIKDPLQIVHGRVLGPGPQTSTVILEFAPERRPEPGTVWTGEGGALAEVLRPLNPSDVLAAVRCGPSPHTGTTLQAHPQPLHTPAPEALWQTSARPCLGPSEQTPSLPLGTLEPGAGAASEVQPPSKQPQWTFGHPGVDVLAPLMGGEALALYEPDPAALASLAAAHVPFIAEQAKARVLWVAGSPQAPSPPKGVEAIELRAQPHHKGQQALLMRATLTIAQAIEGPLLVVFYDPMPALVSWKEVDGLGASSGQMALAQFQAALDGLHTKGATVLGFVPDDPLWTGRLGPGDLSPGRTMASQAHFAHGKLDLSQCSTAVVKQTSAPLQAMNEACRELLAASEALSDYAQIFGEQELDEGLDEVLSIHAGLQTWLSAKPSVPQTLDNTLKQGTQIIQG